MVDLNVIVKEGGRAATFFPVSKPVHSTNAYALQKDDKGGMIGYGTRQRDFYNAWGKYLNRIEVENYSAVIVSSAYGGYIGTKCGWAIGFLSAALVATNMNLFAKLVPSPIAKTLIYLSVIPVAIAVYHAVGIPASALGKVAGSHLSTIAIGFLSSNPETRDLALQALSAALGLVFLWWLPTSSLKSTSCAYALLFRTYCVGFTVRWPVICRLSLSGATVTCTMSPSKISPASNSLARASPIDC